MKKLVLLALAMCGLIASAAQANRGPRHICHGFHYRDVTVQNLIAYDVTCKKATALAHRYYDLAKPGQRLVHDSYGGFKIKGFRGDFRGFAGPIGGPIVRSTKHVDQVVKIHGPAYRPESVLST